MRSIEDIRQAIIADPENKDFTKRGIFPFFLKHIRQHALFWSDKLREVVQKRQVSISETHQGIISVLG